jgi:polyether ionophore transport system permease protein
MSALAGTAELVRLNLRRDRIVIPVCVVAFVATALLTTSSLDNLYPTRADRVALGATIVDNPAISAVRGNPRELDTLGGLVTFQIGVLFSVFVALISLLLVGRHTRGDEEAGRAELVLSTATGRYAPTTAALLVAAGADLLIAAGVTLGLLAYGLPVAGSLALGVWFGAVGLIFAAVAAVSAQLSPNARTASGIALAVLGASYALRAGGDAGADALSWLSPIGWAQQTRPFADERWWPLLLLLTLTIALVALAYRLLARRDHGAGLLPERPGPRTAAPALGSPLGLALRLQRGTLIAWSLGLGLLGIVYGAVAEGIEDLVEDNDQLREIFARVGAVELVDSFYASSLLILALIGTGFTIQSTLRARGEESAGRAAVVLATATSRASFGGSHLAVALAGSGLLLAVGGLGEGIGVVLSTGEPGDLPRLVGASLAHLPAMWVLGGIAALVFGLAPRAVMLVWSAFALCFFLGMFGEVLDLPGWLIGFSPFSHIPDVPATGLTLAPLIVLTLIAAALIAAGLAAFRHRDLATD